KELEGWLTTIKEELKEVKSKYETEQRTVVALNSEMAEIKKQDRDYGQEALDAQHLANERKNYLERIGVEMDVQYEPANDKSLVEAILNEIATRDRAKLPQTQNQQLIT